eukprot:1192277-Heterocapsa_arctica.AAC.1
MMKVAVSRIAVKVGGVADPADVLALNGVSAHRNVRSCFPCEFALPLRLADSVVVQVVPIDVVLRRRGSA